MTKAGKEIITGAKQALAILKKRQKKKSSPESRSRSKEKNDYSDIAETDSAFWADSKLKGPQTKQRRRLTDHK